MLFLRHCWRICFFDLSPCIYLQAGSVRTVSVLDSRVQLVGWSAPHLVVNGLWAKTLVVTRPRFGWGPRTPLRARGGRLGSFFFLLSLLTCSCFSVGALLRRFQRSASWHLITTRVFSSGAVISFAVLAAELASGRECKKPA